MTNTSKGWSKIFLGFGILTIISGIYLTVRGDYIGGISGSIVGAFIAFQNWQVLNDKTDVKNKSGK